MSTLDRIAYFQGRRDEVPNQELARDSGRARGPGGHPGDRRSLVAPRTERPQRLSQGVLRDRLSQAGVVAPDAGDFLTLLGSRNNRLVWGAMIGLVTVAEIVADEIYPHAAEIQRAMAGGTIITLDAGVLALSCLWGTGDDRRTALLPYSARLLAGLPALGRPAPCGAGHHGDQCRQQG